MIDRIICSIRKNENIVNLLLIFIGLYIFAVIPLNSVPVDLRNSKGYGEGLTAFSSNIVNNWLIDGIWNDNFVMYGDFASVEFENYNKRLAYISYPPGSQLPLYFTARIIGEKEVSFSFIKRFLQFEYYLSIVFLGILFYECLKILEIKSRLLIIGLPVLLSSLWAFLPYNLYYMNNVYFSDEAVIFLSIIFFLIEILLSSKQFEKWTISLQILSGIVLFWGVLTDYYFVCIAFVAICLRMIACFQDHPEKSVLYKLFANTWPLIAGITMALALFAVQISRVPGGLKLLAVTFLIRTGRGEDYGGLKALIENFTMGFPTLFIPIIVCTVIYCIISIFKFHNYSKDKQMIISWLSLIVFSTVLHTVILLEHTIVHEFSMLKYNLVFVFIIFAFFCWTYVNYLTKGAVRIKKYSSFVLIFTVCLVIFCFLNLKSYDQLFYNKRINTPDHPASDYETRTGKKDNSIAKLIRGNTNYYDVVYSPDYEINWDPPQDLTISKKRIYKVSCLNDIPVKDLPNYATINILVSEETMRNRKWEKLNKGRIPHVKSGNFYLFKFSRDSFSFLIGFNK